MATSTPTLLPVFAYGTLRKGGDLHGFVEPYLLRVEPACLYGAQIYSLGQFPGLLLDSSVRTPVRGDLLYVLPEWWGSVIQTLDRLENEGRLYNRISVVVMSSRHQALMAWCYLLHMTEEYESFMERIESNDWMRKETVMRRRQTFEARTM